MLETKSESSEKDYVHTRMSRFISIYENDEPHWVSCSFAKEKLYMQDQQDARYNHTMKKQT